MSKFSLPLSARPHACRRSVWLSRVVIASAVMLLSVPAFTGAASAQAMTVEPTFSETRLASAPHSDGSVTFTVTITTSDRTQATGTVKIVDETTQSLIGVVDAVKASIRVPQLSPGPHAIRAYYSGSDGVFPYLTGPSVSLPLQYTSLFMPQVEVAVLQDMEGGQLVTLSATVTAQGASPRGLVAFKDGDRVLATQTLDSSGRAAFITSALDEGSHLIVAEYQGSATLAPAMSAARMVDVGQQRLKDAAAVRGPPAPRNVSSRD